jgi:hypothetical protein
MIWKEIPLHFSTDSYTRFDNQKSAKISIDVAVELIFVYDAGSAVVFFLLGVVFERVKVVAVVFFLREGSTPFDIGNLSICEIVKVIMTADKKDRPAYVKEEQTNAEDTVPPVVEKQPATLAIKLEDVRTVLAEISRSGKTAQMKELLGMFGASKLSDVNPEDYAALLAAAKEVKNA